MTAIITAAVAIAAVMIHIFRRNIDGESIGRDVGTLDVGCLWGWKRGEMERRKQIDKIDGTMSHDSCHFRGAQGVKNSTKRS